jgi:hypothetical protein
MRKADSATFADRDLAVLSGAYVLDLLRGQVSVLKKNPSDRLGRPSIDDGRLLAGEAIIGLFTGAIALLDGNFAEISGWRGFRADMTLQLLDDLRVHKPAFDKDFSDAGYGRAGVGVLTLQVVAFVYLALADHASRDEKRGELLFKRDCHKPQRPPWGMRNRVNEPTAGALRTRTTPQ